MIARRWRLTLFLLGCLAFLLHAETINHQLVFDDHIAIKQNSTVTEGWDIKRIITSGFWGKEREHYVAAWRPFVTLTFVLNHAVHDLDPAGYHFINIILHAVACVFLVLLGARLGLSRTAALMAGVLFALHPVHVDTIAPGVGRADLLLAVMSFTTFLLWEQERTVLAIVALMLALLSKEMGVVTLVAVAIREWTRDGLRLALPKTYKRVIPLVVLLALWLVARYLVLGRIGKQGVGYLENPVATADFLTRFWTAGALYTKALSLFAVPWTLIREYSYAALPPVTGPTVSSVVGWVLLLATSALALIVAKKRSPLLIPILLWLGGFLLLSHLGPRLPMIFAERVLYLPTGGLILALGFALDALPSRPMIRYAVFALWVLACSAYGARSVYRIRDWKDDITLAKASLEEAPNAIKNIQNAVNILYMNGLINEEEAKRHLKRAFRIKEDHEAPHLAAAQFYIRIDNPKKARYHIERAREIRPKLSDIWVAECVYAAKYERDKAVTKCREAVKRAPNNPKPWGYLAVAFDHQGDPKRAAIAFKLAIKGMKAPDFGVYFNFGVFLARNQQYRYARDMFSAILAFDPEHKKAREYLLEIEMILERTRREKGALK